MDYERRTRYSGKEDESAEPSSEIIESGQKLVESILNPELFSEDFIDSANSLLKTVANVIYYKSKARTRENPEQEQPLADSIALLNETRFDLLDTFSIEEYHHAVRIWTTLVESIAASVKNKNRKELIEALAELLSNLKVKVDAENIYSEPLHQLYDITKILFTLLHYNPAIQPISEIDKDHSAFINSRSIAAVLALNNSCIEPSFLEKIIQENSPEPTNDSNEQEKNSEFFEEKLLNFLLDYAGLDEQAEKAKIHVLLKKIKKGSATLNNVTLNKSNSFYGNKQPFFSEFTFDYTDYVGDSGKKTTRRLKINTPILRENIKHKLKWENFLSDLSTSVFTGVAGYEEITSQLADLSGDYNAYHLYHEHNQNALVLKAQKLRQLFGINGVVSDFSSPLINIDHHGLTLGQVRQLQSQKESYYTRIAEQKELDKAIATTFAQEVALRKPFDKYGSPEGSFVTVKLANEKKLLDVYLKDDRLSFWHIASQPVEVLADTHFINHNKPQTSEFRSAYDIHFDEVTHFDVTNDLEYAVVSCDGNWFVAAMNKEDGAYTADVSFIEGGQQSADLLLLADFLNIFKDKLGGQLDQELDPGEIIPIVNQFLSRIEEADFPDSQKHKMIAVLMVLLRRFVGRGILDTSVFDLFLKQPDVKNDQPGSKKKDKNKKHRQLEEEKLKSSVQDLKRFINLVTRSFDPSDFNVEQLDETGRYQYMFYVEAETVLLELFREYRDNPSGLKEELVERLKNNSLKKEQSHYYVSSFQKLRNKIFRKMVGNNLDRKISPFVQKLLLTPEKNNFYTVESPQEHLDKIMEMASRYWESLDLQESGQLAESDYRAGRLWDVGSVGRKISRLLSNVVQKRKNSDK